jgi:hypothetical protein
VNKAMRERVRKPRPRRRDLSRRRRRNRFARESRPRLRARRGASQPRRFARIPRYRAGKKIFAETAARRHGEFEVGATRRAGGEAIRVIRAGLVPFAEFHDYFTEKSAAVQGPPAAG